MDYSKQLRTHDIGSALLLLCPRCGAESLHHIGAVSYERGEDDVNVLRLTQTLPGLGNGRVVGMMMEIVPSDCSQNPSSRRNGLAIRFICEQCGGGTADNRIELTVGQHTGTTEIGWRFTAVTP